MDFSHRAKPSNMCVVVGQFLTSNLSGCCLAFGAQRDAECGSTIVRSRGHIIGAEVYGRLEMVIGRFEHVANRISS